MLYLSYDILNGVYNMRHIETAYASNGMLGIMKLYNECNYYQCFVLYNSGCFIYTEFLTFIVECAKDEKASLIMENMIASALGLFDDKHDDTIHDNAQIIIDIMSEIAQNEGPDLFNILDLYKNKLYIMNIVERYKYAFSTEVMTYIVNAQTACEYIDVVRSKPYLNDIADIEMILNAVMDEWEIEMTEGCIFEGSENHIDKIKDELSAMFIYTHNTIVHFFEDNSENTPTLMTFLLDLIKRRMKTVILNTNFNTSQIICVRALMDVELYIPSLRILCQHSIDNYSISWMSELVTEVITEMCTIDTKMYNVHYERCRIDDFINLVDDIRNTEFSYTSMVNVVAMLEAYASRTERADALLDNPSTIDRYLDIYYVVKDRILFVDTGDYNDYRELSTGNNEDFTQELNALDDIMDWLV